MLNAHAMSERWYYVFETYKSNTFFSFSNNINTNLTYNSESKEKVIYLKLYKKHIFVLNGCTKSQNTFVNTR